MMSKYFVIHRGIRTGVKYGCQLVFKADIAAAGQPQCSVAPAVAFGRWHGGGASRLLSSNAVDWLRRRIAALDKKILEIGDSSAHITVLVRVRHGSNKVNLAYVLDKVPTGKAMRVIDAAKAAQKAGYKTVSKSSRVQVNTALITQTPQAVPPRGAWGSTRCGSDVRPRCGNCPNADPIAFL